MDKKAFGRRINMARRERGLTGEKLAELCNINATYLRQIEGGVKVPSLPIFISICEQLKTSPNYLLRDSLVNVEYCDYDDLSSLLKNASPEDISIIMKISKTVLEALEERNKVQS